ncbi:MAG: hypothetical protein K2J81_03460 [Treponemataceae bacterium]|nr:hypothetical protein [Treponemataceae bacterium]
MKLTKKLLLASAVLCAASLGFMACDNEDDPEGAITGSNNSYKVYYNNANGYVPKQGEEDADVKTGIPGVYRAWNRTSLKHLGALTKITLNSGLDMNSQASKAGANSGVMGFAWDLKSEDGKDSDDASETFNVVGIRNYGGKVQAYLSRFYNVTEKSKNNFGAKTLTKKGTSAQITSADVEGKTVEWDISNGSDGGYVNLMTAPATDTLDLWVDVAIKPTAADLASNSLDGKFGQSLTRAVDGYDDAAAGSWVIAIYDADPSLESTGVSHRKVSWIIPATSATSLGSGYNEGGSNSAEVLDTSKNQKKQAVYANIYKGATLSGEWNYAKTYFLANVAPVDGE